MIRNYLILVVLGLVFVAGGGGIALSLEPCHDYRMVADPGIDANGAVSHFNYDELSGPEQRAFRTAINSTFEEVGLTRLETLPLDDPAVVEYRGIDYHIAVAENHCPTREWRNLVTIVPIGIGILLIVSGLRSRPS